MTICKAEGCEEQGKLLGYCHRHYYQMRRHGKTTMVSNTTPNEIFEKDGICYLKLYDIHNFERSEIATFSPEDKEMVGGKRWGLTGNGYVVSQQYGLLHRFLLGAKSYEEIDHKDRNPLNNCRDNLRFCTSAQNKANANLMKTNKSGYRGVSWNKKDKVWVAQTSKNNKSFCIGRFKNKEKAALAYNSIVLELHGEFARLNEVA